MISILSALTLASLSGLTLCSKISIHIIKLNIIFLIFAYRLDLKLKCQIKHSGMLE